MDHGTRIQVLLIEDNDEYAVVVSRSLARPGNAPCEVGRVASLEEALARLGEQRFDVILLDLSLPDSQGLEGINRLRIYCPEVPVVVLTASDSETLGVESVRTGAQDYLVKGQADGRLLSRAIRYAMARNQTQDVLRSLALREELTGLYNRRGFVTLAEQHLKLARRAGRAVLLVFVDVNGFKRVNDRFGHPEGDRALVGWPRSCGRRSADRTSWRGWAAMSSRCSPSRPPTRAPSGCGPDCPATSKRTMPRPAAGTI